MKKKTIPEIRARLKEIAALMLSGSIQTYEAAKEIDQLADETVRRSPVAPRARIKSRELTPELAARIRRHKRLYPSVSNQQIANEFGVNPGRVSEALHRDV